MTLPANLTMQQVNLELGRAAGFGWDMNTDISARQLAQVSLTPGTSWGLASLAGKSGYPNTMTVVKSPDINQWGYSDGSGGGSFFGNLTPQLVSGQVIAMLVCGAGDGPQITIKGTLPKNYWTTLELKDNINGQAYARFNSINAIFYQTNAGRTDWGAFPGAAGFENRVGQTVYAIFMK